MLHLIPFEDGLPHAPTSECGCDPQPSRLDNDPVLVHFPGDLLQVRRWQTVPGFDDPECSS